MSTKVKSTTNYSQFRNLPGNRPVEGRLNKLITSIVAKNQLHLYPIVCFKDKGGALYVADGQHRLRAAQTLKLPIFFIEDPHITLSDVIRDNANQRQWSLKDHLFGQAELANPNYVTLKAFHDQYKLNISACAALLNGGFQGSHGLIASGTFKVKQSAVKPAHETAKFMLELKGTFSGALDRGFAIAILKLVQVHGFSTERLKQKLEYQSTRLVKCADWRQYVSLIEEIYNYRSRPQDIISLTTEVKKQGAR